MQSTEQEEIVRTVQRLLGDRKAARKAAEGGPGIDRELWSRFAELGLTAIALPEGLGGSGLTLAEECAAVEAASAFVAPLPLVTAYAAAHVLGAGDGEAAAEVAQALAGGAQSVGVALSAETGLPASIGVQPEAADRGRLTGEIADLFEGGLLDVALVCADGAWWAVDLRGAGVELNEIATLDATRRQAHAVFDQAPARRVGAADPDRVLSVARLLIGAEGLGAAQAALDMAADYSLTRRQFGQPIGRFQAIKHKLADALMKTEGARSAVWGALRSLKDGWPDPVAARLAKAEGGAAAAFSAAEAVQTHGAMGVTWEHDLHLILKRAKHCQLSLGSPDQHLRALGDHVLELERAGKTPRTRGAKLDIGFTPSPEDEAFIAPFRAWLDEHMTEDAVAKIRRGGLSAAREWQAQMAEAGWVGIHWPSQYGGRDASFTQQILYYAEMVARGLPNLPGNRGLMLVGPTLIAHGTDEQKKLLEPTRRSDILWSGGFSERGAGSDLASLQTRGVIEGDEIVVNGHKIWTSQAQLADYLYALIRTGPQHPKHAGISVVIIPMKTAGVEVRPIRRNNGDFHFNEVFFDDVRIPLANLVGPLNEGWRVNRTTMVGEHLTNFLGSNAAQATTIRRVARELVGHEAKYGADPDLRRRFAEAWAINQIINLHGLRNVARFTGGQNPGAEGSIQKVVGQEQERRLFELMIDVQGAGGLKDGVWTRAYLSTRASTIGGGTSEIHRNKLAERVLGLPRDLWADEEPAGPKGAAQPEMLDG